MLTNNFGLTDDKSLKLRSIISECYCNTEVVNSKGNPHFGFFNLKQIYSNPQSVSFVVDLLSSLIRSDAICAVDPGIAPIVGAVSYSTSLPSVYARRSPKGYFISYGNTHEHNNKHLMGGMIHGTVTLVDDVINTGKSAAKACEILKTSGLQVESAIFLMNAKNNDDNVTSFATEFGVETKVLVKASEVVPTWSSQKNG